MKHTKIWLKLNLLFTSVQEGRCPTGTNCIQAGKAKLSMDFGVGDSVSAIKLEAKGLCEDDSGKCGGITNAQGYTIKLFALYPYPSEENNGIPSTISTYIPCSSSPSYSLLNGSSVPFS